MRCPATKPRKPRRPTADTVRLYAADWNAFVAWCKSEGLAVSATGGGVSRRRGNAERRGAGGSRLAGGCSGGDRHPPRVALRCQTASPPPARPARLVRMAGACQGGLAGARDRALLLLAASGLGRAALVGLDVEHVRITDAAADLVIAGLEADGGRRVAIRRAANRDVCPAQAQKDWLATSETSFGPVFRKIDRWGNIEHRRLGTDALRRILARRTLRRGRTSKAAAA